MSPIRKPFVIAVALFLILLAYLITPRIGSGRNARVAATRADIATLQLTLDEFRQNCGRYPTTVEGLNALISQPTSLPGWRGPYIKGWSTPLADPWGHPYIYIRPGVHNTNGFDLYSCGRDGITRSGGSDPDDFNNWSRQ